MRATRNSRPHAALQRPYSWNGCYDDIVPPISQMREGSNDHSKYIVRDELPRNVRSNHRCDFDEYTQADLPFGENGGLQSSSNALLTEHLPLYLRWDPQEQKVRPLRPGELQSTRNRQSSKTSVNDRKKTKFPRFHRKCSPPLVTSDEDFEYFSLADPPTGLSKPVEIFPPKESLAVESKRKNRTRRQNPPEAGDNCNGCMTRMPYGSIIATLLCCTGVIVFCISMYRGTTLTIMMLDEVFKIKVTWVEPVQLTFIIVGAAMGGVGLMILFLGCLSTGSTRGKVYKTWRGRVGGRISCAVFMGITYLLSLIWLVILCAMTIATVFNSIAWFQCRYIPENQCIDYNQVGFLFPESSNEEDKRVCQEERKIFCKDCINYIEPMFIIATVFAYIIVLSLINYLMCLSANYAHIKDQEKFMDLQEIQFLQDSEMSTLPKDRF